MWGGGAGVYAFWLAGLGYTVHLVDAMPLHIEQARQEAEKQAVASLASLTVGDARRLDFADGSAEAVLLMGPLYHLIHHANRLQALREAYRVLKPRGIVCAVAISRFASALDGMCRGYLLDSAFIPIVEQDLASGQHRNPNQHPAYFTTAFLHHPNELRTEVNDAGFVVDCVIGIEGPGWMLHNFADFWTEDSARATLLHILRAMESEPSLLGVSAHILAIGRKAS